MSLAQQRRNETAIIGIVKLLEEATEGAGWDMELGGLILSAAGEGWMLKARLLREIARQNEGLEFLPNKKVKGAKKLAARAKVSVVWE